MRANFWALAVACLGAGCAAPPPPVVQGAAVEAPVVAATAAAPSGARGRAALCDTSRIGRHRLGQGAPVSMTVSGEGGWCSKAFTYSGHPFDRGDVTDQPGHGEVRVVRGSRSTLVEYRAAPGYAGPDRFAVTLYPGASTYLVDVTVR